MNTLLQLADLLLFVLLAINGLYLLVYSLASLRPLRRLDAPDGCDAALASSPRKHRFALLIAAYREDAVIRSTVAQCLRQDYPRELYDVVVISDHMQPSTNEALRTMGATLLQVDFEKSTNTKSLRFALEALPQHVYDLALIVDADNIIPTDYLTRLNAAFARDEVMAVQTHRVAKNLNTTMAYLDAISEEINNSIFRHGHNALGMSSALIGSGMAFRYDLFRELMLSNTSVGGFDRVLEMKLLYRRIFIYYMPDLCIKDEKIQQTHNFYNQRRRWLAAQYDSFAEFLHKLPSALRARNWDFCDKLFQQAALSRVLLLGFVFVIALLTLLLQPAWALKWWVLLGVVALALACAIPRRYYTWRLLRAVCLVPWSFLLMAANLFRMKEARHRFIHTTHGIPASDGQQAESGQDDSGQTQAKIGRDDSGRPQADGEH